MERFVRRIEGMRIYLPPLDAGKLKYFAAAVMLLDHITCAFLERAYGSNGRPLMYSLPQGKLIDSIGRAIGRQAFPIFCFFLVEGFFHTRSRLRYFAQLMVFAALSQVPFQKCIFPRAEILHANVMCTLGMGLLAIWVIEELRGVFLHREDDAGTTSPSDGSAAPVQDLFRRVLFLFASGSVVYGLSRLAKYLHSDYSYGGVVLIVLLYLLRDYRILSLFISWAWLSWYNKLELYALPAFFLLAGYNGKRGRQQKYFFYVFYPAHLAVLWLLRRHFFGI